MFDDGKMIYQKRYCAAEKLAQEMEATQQSDMGAGSQKMQREDSAFIHNLSQKYVCKPRPDRVAGRDIFIELAKKFSADHEIDIQITQQSYFVEAALRMDHAAYFKDGLQTLSSLMEMCDRICTFAIAGDMGHFRLYLDYYTHDCWVWGKRVRI